MRTSWPLQKAKNQFSQVVDRAMSEGPQTVTRHGKPVVVVSAVLGCNRQVLAVTHLPQVAAQGDEKSRLIESSTRNVGRMTENRQHQGLP